MLPVLLFHAGVEGFSGGYVGVDIFFVISGYLITSIILKDCERNKFSLVDFYERRARRILPALSLVLFVTSLVSWVLLPPVQLTEFAQSLVAAMAFASNVFLYLTTDYFSTAADQKPLLHLWSLGVEEQFYLAFPLLIAGVFRWGRRGVMTCVVALAVISFALSEYLLAQKSFTANYFLPFSRAWELLAGASLAAFPSPRHFKHPLVENSASLLGLLLIAASVVLYSPDTPFPGRYALAPVLGTMLVIHCAREANAGARLLSQKALVAIGLISYPLYLWHQPLFAYLRVLQVGEPSQAMFLAAGLASLGLAYLSFRFIEAPFRNRKVLGRAKIFRYSLAAMGLFTGLGLLAHIKKGFPTRYSADMLYAAPEKSPQADDCYSYDESFLRPEQACRYFGSKVTWAVLGDSHAQEPAFALAERLKSRDEGVLELSFMGCPPILNYEAKAAGCSEWLKKSVQALESDAQIQNVVLAFRHTLYVHGENAHAYPDVQPENTLPARLGLNSSLSLEDSEALYAREFRLLVQRLQAAQKRIYLLFPIPELPMDIRKGRWPRTIFDRGARLDPQHATPKKYYEERQEFALRLLNSFAFGEKLVALQTFPKFCPGDFCVAAKDQQLLYRDDDHLSVVGARYLVSDLPLAASP